MPFLDAALAFALTMLVVATTASMVLRFFHFLFSYRLTNLKKLLNDFADKELDAVLEAELHRLSTTVGKALVTDLIKAGNDEKGIRKKALTELVSHVNTEKLVEVSTNELLDRLKQSEFGKNLLKTVGEKANEVFAAVGSRFETFGDQVTTSYRNHSRKWTTTFAFVLALIVNIDSVFVAHTYLRNDKVRESVIKQMDMVVKNYETNVEKLELKEGETSAKELKEAFVSAKNEIATMRSLGFPIGWSYYPHACFLADEKDVPDPAEQKETLSRSEVEGRPKHWLARFMLWLLGIVATGVLGGFGAPFWFDTVRGIRKLTGKPKP